MARRVFGHMKVRPLVAWKNAHHAYETIAKMDHKQFGLYQSVIDHVAGRTHIKIHYPTLHDKMFEGLHAAKKKFPGAFQALHAAASAGKDALIRYHKNAHADELKAGGFFSALGDAGKSAMKGIGSAAKSVGKGIAKAAGKVAEGASHVANKAWSSVKSASKYLATKGGKLTKWAADNPKKLAQLVDIVKSGVDIGLALSKAGAPKDEPEKDVSPAAKAKQKQMEDLLADTDDDDSDLESE